MAVHGIRGSATVPQVQNWAMGPRSLLTRLRPANDASIVLDPGPMPREIIIALSPFQKSCIEDYDQRSVAGGALGGMQPSSGGYCARRV